MIDPFPCQGFAVETRGWIVRNNFDDILKSELWTGRQLLTLIKYETEFFNLVGRNEKGYRLYASLMFAAIQQHKQVKPVKKTNHLHHFLYWLFLPKNTCRSIIKLK